jgi:hypothetical protein
MGGTAQAAPAPGSQEFLAWYREHEVSAGQAHPSAAAASAAAMPHIGHGYLPTPEALGMFGTWRGLIPLLFTELGQQRAGAVYDVGKAMQTAQTPGGQWWSGAGGCRPDPVAYAAQEQPAVHRICLATDSMPWFLHAASLHHADAWLELARDTLHGSGHAAVLGNASLAAAAEAAKRGSLDAQLWLGMAYFPHEEPAEPYDHARFFAEDATEVPGALREHCYPAAAAIAGLCDPAHKATPDRFATVGQVIFRAAPSPRCPALGS